MATITKATHAHVHDVSHDHSISQTPHGHPLFGAPFGFNGNSYITRDPRNLGEIVGGTPPADWEWSSAVGGGNANISVDTKVMNSAGASPESVTIEQADHYHLLAKFGYGDNEIVSITTTPPYQAVYTWYRES